MTYNEGLTFSMGDTIPRFILISLDPRPLELVTLNIIYRAVSIHTEEYGVA